LSKMKNNLTYDYIIIGSGAGLIVADAALEKGKRVAIIEQDRFGGTCLNYGCIPSKMLTYPADIIQQAKHARKIGVNFSRPSVDLHNIMGRIKELQSKSKIMAESYAKLPGCEVLIGQAKIIAANQVKVFAGDKERILHGHNIIIATGAKPNIPAFPGNELALHYRSFFEHLPNKPYPRLVILGAGTISCEFAHFFSTLNTKVTIVGRSGTILKSEDGDVQTAIIQCMRVAGVSFLLTHRFDKIEQSENEKVVHLTNTTSNESIKIPCDEVIISAGVKSTAPELLDPAVGVELDRNNYIVTDKNMATSIPGIYAIGDINGHHMFRHTANQEAKILVDYLFEQKQSIINYQAVPHAVFTTPQIAGVGQTEEQVKKSGIPYKRGMLHYRDVAYGWAMGYGDDDDGGFVKVLTDQNNRILGAHAIGYQAAALIQPFVYLMNTGDGSLTPLLSSQPIHPSINELAAWAAESLILIGGKN
jgi:mycothione reductase